MVPGPLMDVGMGTGIEIINRDKDGGSKILPKSDPLSSLVEPKNIKSKHDTSIKKTGEWLLQDRFE